MASDSVAISTHAYRGCLFALKIDRGFECPM